MKYVSDIRLPAIAIVLALSLFTVFVTEYLQAHLLSAQARQIETEAQRDLAVIRSNLEAQIYSDIYYANSLATLVSANPDSTVEQWERIAKELFHRSSNLRNIGIAPNDVISFVYPMKGNEKALGLDFRTVPSQWETVKIARDSQSLFIAGPVNLVQGGLGLIARNPIFTDPPLNNEYWGTCSVVLDLDSLFINSGINQLEQKYQFAMRGLNGEGVKGEIFYGSPEVFRDIVASETVVLPSGTWYMAVSSQGLESPLPWYQIYAARLIGYPTLIIIIALFTIIYMLYRVAHVQSLQDELTHLPNRRYFMYSLEQAVQDSLKKESCFTLLNLDLNYFKSINDTYGHAVGDRVLITVAKKIKKVIRASDLVARVGGDEFLVLLPRLTDEETIKKIIGKLREELASQPVKAGYSQIFPEASIGYAVYKDSSETVDSILHDADINMYKDKLRQKTNQ